MLTCTFPRKRRDTRRQGPAGVPARPLIDIGTALDLLAAAVADRGGSFVYPPVPDPDRTCLFRMNDGPGCLVAHALSMAGVDVDELAPLRHDSIRELYRQDRLPVRLTLGALVVLAAAERSEDHGCTWGAALGRATDAAARFVDLLPVRELVRDRHPVVIGP
ncbi:MAG: hypothetical protein QOG80_409 [Pseudonocardiales bacterium]|nr:hypothetical protein [Pseudonocardiales bacterium]